MTAATRQISAANIVQSARGVTPRNAETDKNRPASTASTIAIKGARMISPAESKRYCFARSNALSVNEFGQ